MGGSGSDGGGGSFGGGGGVQVDKCNIRFQTDLFQPIAGVADQLAKGDGLEIQLYPPGNPSGVSALTKSSSEVAGTLAGVSQLPTLIECLQGGETYEAEVVGVSGSKITILVERG